MGWLQTGRALDGRAGILSQVRPPHSRRHRHPRRSLRLPPREKRTLPEGGRGRVRGRDWKEKSSRYLRYIYLRLVRVHDTPHRVAAGFSLGVFLGVFPTFGIAIPLSYLLATLFRVNRGAAIVGSLIMNPVTTPLFWSASAAVGGFLFREDAEKILRLWKEGERLWSLTRGTLIYLAGNTIVSLVVSAVSYGAAYVAVKKYRERKASESR
ncbi:MAG: DUF2062 domain-containing protein [Deltaproteobacteria bacterium]|nr:MAG: DUF2062 domain-containing protein [Deltaproteobacteria bacterium]